MIGNKVEEKVSCKPLIQSEIVSSVAPISALFSWWFLRNWFIVPWFTRQKPLYMKLFHNFTTYLEKVKYLRTLLTYRDVTSHFGNLTTRRLTTFGLHKFSNYGSSYKCRYFWRAKNLKWTKIDNSSLNRIYQEITGKHQTLVFFF